MCLQAYPKGLGISLYLLRPDQMSSKRAKFQMYFARAAYSLPLCTAICLEYRESPLGAWPVRSFSSICCCGSRPEGKRKPSWA